MSHAAEEAVMFLRYTQLLSGFRAGAVFDRGLKLSINGVRISGGRVSPESPTTTMK